MRYEHRCPTFIIHGTKDEVVPFWHAQELLQTFPPQYRAQPFWAEGLGHNNIEVYLKKKFVAKTTAFLNRYVHARKGLPIKNSDENIPVSIPESEQGKPDPAVLTEGKFFVNQTWLRYGKQIVNEAISSKNKRNGVRQMQMQLKRKGARTEPVRENVTTEKNDNLIIYTTMTRDIVRPDAPGDENGEDENTNTINCLRRKPNSHQDMEQRRRYKNNQLNRRPTGVVKVTQVRGLKRQQRKREI